MVKAVLPPKRQVKHLTLLRQGRKISLAEYNALAIDEQLNIIHQARGKHKYDLLINAQQVEKLVPLLHPQELYLTVNELGAEYSTELLMLASPEQLTTLLDLDCWDGDDLSQVLSLYWLELLLTTGEEKICQLAREMEPEILTLFLKKHLTIIRGLEAYDDDDAENANRLESLYDIQYSSENAAKIIGAILKIWLDREQESYLLIMEMIRSENLSVLEEEVYQARSHRLLDLGIIPVSEAKTIYGHIDPETFTPGGKSDFRLEAENLQHPAALLACGSPHNLLAAILADNIDHDTACELLFLVNRKMSADAIDIAEMEAVTEAFQSTYDTLNLALEFLVGTSIEEAREIFHNTYLLHLFQLGHSLISKLQTRAKELSARPVYPYLDYPELLFIDALLQNPPQLEFDGDNREPGQLKKLTTLADLQQAELRLTQIEALQKLFFTKLPFEPPEPEIEATEYPSLSGLFLTAVGNQLLDKGFVPIPLATTDLPRLKQQTISDNRIDAAFEQEIFRLITQLAPDCEFFARFCLDTWQQFFLDFNAATDNPAAFSTLIIDQ